jgi:hypothetical protein
MTGPFRSVVVLELIRIGFEIICYTFRQPFLTEQTVFGPKFYKSGPIPLSFLFRVGTVQAVPVLTSRARGWLLKSRTRSLDMIQNHLKDDSDM